MISICTPHRDAQGKVVSLSGTMQDITERQQADEERRNLQKMSARTEQIAQIGSWEWEPATDKVSWSDELFRIFQIDPAEGAPSFAEQAQIFGHEDLARIEAAKDAAVDQGTPYALELLARRRDGSTRLTNPAFSAVTGYERASVLGKDPSILASDRHDAAFFRGMWDEITHRGGWRGEIWNRRQDGESYARLLSISVVQDAEQRVQNYIRIFSDISELKAREAELDRLANYDQLTGLPNRRLLSDRLEKAIAGSRRSGSQIAVCYLDLDDFKPINDQHGHAVGDQVLIAIADVAGCLPAHDRGQRAVGWYR